MGEGGLVGKGIRPSWLKGLGFDSQSWKILGALGKLLTHKMLFSIMAKCNRFQIMNKTINSVLYFTEISRLDQSISKLLYTSRHKTFSAFTIIMKLAPATGNKFLRVWMNEGCLRLTFCTVRLNWARYNWGSNDMNLVWITGSQDQWLNLLTSSPVRYHYAKVPPHHHTHPSWEFEICDSWANRTFSLLIMASSASIDWDRPCIRRFANMRE